MARRACGLAFALVLAAAVPLCGCGAGTSGSASTDTTVAEGPAEGGATSLSVEPEANVADDEPAATDKEEQKMLVTVSGTAFSATLESNVAADALAKKLAEGAVTGDAHDYSGFEKVGPLGFSLPADNEQMTTRAGDIVLYNGNQIVAFYGSNSWSYTKLATVDDLAGWADALGAGDAQIAFALQ